MKITIDPVYTSKPSTCSTSYLAWQLIAEVSAANEGVFFYLLYPEQVKDDLPEMEWLTKKLEQNTNVTLVYIPQQFRDRMYELFAYDKDLFNLIGGMEQLWDTDIVITSRIPQIPNMRVQSSRPVPVGKGTFRAIIGIDEMPVFSFRPTVAWGASKEVDLMSLNAYLMADKILVNNLWTEKPLKALAKLHLTPSRVKEVMDNVVECVPVKLSPLAENKKKPLKKTEGITIAFCGRMTSTRNFDEVVELFYKQWAFAVGEHKKNVTFLVSTHSGTAENMKGIPDHPFIKLEFNNREKFYKLLKERAHVVINLSPTEDFSLSTYEPLAFGVPVIVPNKPWTSFLGEDYPFRVEGTAQAYGLLNAFMKDYDSMYALFRKWHDSYWVEFIQSKKNHTTSEAVISECTKWWDTVTAKLAEGTFGVSYAEEAKALAQKKVSPLVIADYWKEAHKTDIEQDWGSTMIGRRPNLHVFKIQLMMNGYVDTNETGVMNYVGK